jgi:hypothetical protein
MTPSAGELASEDGDRMPREVHPIALEPHLEGAAAS